MTQITAVIATLNEEEKIEACLKNISWVDEIIVVDSYSEDNTVGIAEKYADRVIEEESKGYMEPHRNTGIKEASNEWILRIDVDERFSDELNDVLKEKVGVDSDIVFAPRKNIIAGKWVSCCGNWPAFTPVLFRRDSMDISDEIHESLTPKEDANIEYLEESEDLAIIHRTEENFAGWFSTQLRYIKIELDQTEQPSGLILPVVKEFLRRFVYMKGFLHGKEGLIVSLMSAQGQFMKQMIKYEKEGKWA